MKNLEFLVAAYSAIWIVVAVYLVVLLRRNKKLEDAVDTLEMRIQKMEQDAERLR